MGLSEFSGDTIFAPGMGYLRDSHWGCRFFAFCFACEEVVFTRCQTSKPLITPKLSAHRATPIASGDGETSGGSSGPDGTSIVDVAIGEEEGDDYGLF